MDTSKTNGQDSNMGTNAEYRELKAAIREYRRVDIILSTFTIDELAEVFDTANSLLSGNPLTWIAGAVSKELNRREREGAEPGMVRLPIDRFSVDELCLFNQGLRVWLRSEPSPNIKNFLHQVFAIAMVNMSSRFQNVYEASQ